MLGLYAGAFNSVEINYTFRRSPTASMMEGWSKATDEGFVFALKANQGITHFARLKNTGERLGTFLEAVAPARAPARAGAVPVPAEPEVRPRGARRVPGRPGRTPGRAPLRHGVPPPVLRHRRGAGEARRRRRRALRRRHGRAAGEVPAHRRLRLRATAGDGLRRQDPGRVGESFRSALAEGTDVYCYLKHEDSATGPRDAAILKRMAADRLDLPVGADW